MDDQKRIDSQISTSPVKPVIHSCRKNRTKGASFVSDLRDHFHEFMHASMDEHKSCLKNTIQKIFGMSKVALEKSPSSNNKDIESVLSLRTTVSD